MSHDDDRRSTTCAQAREGTDRTAALERDWLAMIADPAWRPGWRPRNPAGFLRRAVRACLDGEAEYLEPLLEWRSRRPSGNGANGNGHAPRLANGRPSPEERAARTEARMRSEGYVHASELPLPPEARQVFERLKGEHRAREVGLRALGEA